MDQNIRPIETYSPAQMAAMPADGFVQPGELRSDGNVQTAESLAAARATVGEPKPFMEQLAEAGAQQLAAPPQFVLVLQDVIDAETGDTLIEVAGVQRPEAFDHTSPCHVVGTWIRAHLPQIFDAARSATLAGTVPQQLRLPDGSIIGARG